MSEEMVTRTADSPAAASEYSGMTAAMFGGSPVAEGNSSAEALTSTDEQADSANDDMSWLDELTTNTDHEGEVRQRIFDTLANNGTPKDVPYERFREVNEQAKANKDQASTYDKWADVIKVFEQNGFQSAADVQRSLQQQQQQQQEESVRRRYSDLVANDVMSSDTASASAEAEILRQKNEQLVSQMSEYMTAQQREVAYSQFPYARRAEQVVDNLISSGISPLQAAEMVHGQIANLAEVLIPEITSMLAAQRSVPTPIDSGNSPQPVVSAQQSRPGVNFSSITRLLGIGRNPNTI
jgi:hypothetical protein